MSSIPVTAFTLQFYRTASGYLAGSGGSADCDMFNSAPYAVVMATPPISMISPWVSRWLKDHQSASHINGILTLPSEEGCC
jgi:hypothetical protein